jgi:hypothetical protein
VDIKMVWVRTVSVRTLFVFPGELIARVSPHAVGIFPLRFREKLLVCMFGKQYFCSVKNKNSTNNKRQ